MSKNNETLLNAKNIESDIDKTTLETFQQRLKITYKEKGYTQETLAQRVGVSKSAIQKWIGGDTDKYGNDSTARRAVMPTLENLIKLSEALDVSIDYLVNPKMVCKTITKQQISDITGLKEASIDNLSILQEIVNHPDEYSPETFEFNELDFLNWLLDNEDNLELLDLFAQYVYGSPEGFIEGDEEYSLIPFYERPIINRRGKETGKEKVFSVYQLKPFKMWGLTTDMLYTYLIDEIRKHLDRARKEENY